MYVFNVARRAVVGTFLRDIYVEIGFGRKGDLILHAAEWRPLGTCQLCYVKHLYEAVSDIMHRIVRRFKLVSAAPS